MTVTTAGRWGRKAQVLRMLACAAALSLAAEASLAQERDLAADLAAGLPCAFDDPANQLATNITQSGAGPVDVANALRRILDDPTRCLAVKVAAETRLAELAQMEQVVNQDTSVLARERAQLALREADLSAASMRFVVGPPPPRLTRNQPSVPTPTRVPGE